KSGETCTESDNALHVDTRTGEVLSCSKLPGFAPIGNAEPYGPFSATDVRRVEDLSQGLAADGSLSDADRAAVRDVIAEISRANGWTKMSPTLPERLTWRIGWFGLVGGLAPPLVLGL